MRLCGCISPQGKIWYKIAGVAWIILGLAEHLTFDGGENTRCCLQLFPVPKWDQAGQVMTEHYWCPQLLSPALGGGDTQAGCGQRGWCGLSLP